MVEIGTDEVSTTVEEAGQLVTSGPQLVTVYSEVVYRVIVDGTAGAEETGTEETEEVSEP